MKGMQNTTEPKNVGTMLVLYYIEPALTAEGDEADAVMIETVTEKILHGHAKYISFAWPETPDVLKAPAGSTGTALYFTFPKAAALPFNSEIDLTLGILKALAKGDGTIQTGDYYDDSADIRQINIELTNVVE